MPIYDFRCLGCKQSCELLVLPKQPPVCPACGSTNLQRLFSGSASVSTTRSRARSLAGARSRANAVKKEKDHAHSEYLRNHIKDHS